VLCGIALVTMFAGHRGVIMRRGILELHVVRLGAVQAVGWLVGHDNCWSGADVQRNEGRDGARERTGN
jgi:hypothetical protein